MKFRYNYTGKVNPILGLPYLEYETLFFSETDNVWKKTKGEIKNRNFVFEVVETDTKIKALQNGNHNFYEYEIDIDQLICEPIKLNSLRNFIIAKRTTDKYKDYIGRVARLKNISKEDKYSIQKLDWYGGLNFKLELGVLFPKLLNELVIRDKKRDLEETFRFIIFDFLNINEILKKEIVEYNKIMNNKMNDPNIA